MVSIMFAVFITIGLPAIALFYAFLKKRYIPFLLGVIAFVVSQVLIRIPILQYLQENSINYSMFSITQPIIFAVLIGFSAGIVEGLGRFIMMRYFMKKRDWLSGFLFGVGHGGIEALLLVGINVMLLLFSPMANVYEPSLFIGSIERFFAMMLHIGLSILVLQGVVQRRFIFVVLAIIIHGFIDSLVVILPLVVPANIVITSLEVTLAITAIAVFSYSIYINRKGVLQ